jgi:hypothetical protein
MRQFDSCVVAAESAAEAATIHPGGYRWSDGAWRFDDGRDIGDDSWVCPALVTAVHVGEASASIKLGRVVCASFNAG